MAPRYCFFERDAGYIIWASYLGISCSSDALACPNSFACFLCLSMMADSPLTDLQLSTIDVTRRLTTQNIALRLPGSSARHDSVRRHVCPECGRAFNRAVHLRVHAGIHSRAVGIAVRHVCSICGRSYLSIDSLRRHTQQKHTELPPPRTSVRHMCSLCDRSYLTIRSFRRHTRRQHATSLDRSALIGGSPLQEPAFLRLYTRFIDNVTYGELVHMGNLLYVKYIQKVSYLFSELSKS